MSVIIGGLVAAIGIITLIAWRSDFFTVLKGCIPIALVFCGIIAVIAGISEMKDESATKGKDK